MFDSGIPANDLIRDLKDEVDAAYEIPDSAYIKWLNALEQLLYSEFIREQNKIVVTDPPVNKIIISSLPAPAGESPVRFEDIHTVYAGGTQLIKSTLTSGVIFPDTYYKHGVDIGYNTDGTVSEITVIYFVRPALKSVGSSDSDHTTEQSSVKIPYEFIELIKARLRGEAYKLCNEDAAAAKWLNDYNALLESFKQWLALRQPSFGM